MGTRAYGQWATCTCRPVFQAGVLLRVDGGFLAQGSLSLCWRWGCAGCIVESRVTAKSRPPGSDAWRGLRELRIEPCARPWAIPVGKMVTWLEEQVPRAESAGNSTGAQEFSSVGCSARTHHAPSPQRCEHRERPCTVGGGGIPIDAADPKLRVLLGAGPVDAPASPVLRPQTFRRKAAVQVWPAWLSG